MVGFEIWYDGQCIHEDNNYEVDEQYELFKDVIAWWEMNKNTEENPQDYCVRFNGFDEADEFSILEIMMVLCASEVR